MGLSRAVIAALSLLLFAWTPLAASEDERDPTEIAPNRMPAVPFAAGVAAFDQGEFGKAHEIWLPWAHRGDPAAQRNLAHLYRMGLGVSQDFTQAAAWYRLAADSGLARAQANLASMYLRGQGVEEDAQQAAYWYASAAVNGHVLGQYNLALLYLRGEGVERNEAKAAGWLYRAAKAGHKPAIQALSNLVGVISGPAGPPNPPDRPASLQEPVHAASQSSVTTRGGPDPMQTPDLLETETIELEQPAMEPGRIGPEKAEAGAVPRRLTQPEEAGSLLEVLAAFFAPKPTPDDHGDSDVVADGSREETARRDFAAGLVALHTANFAAAKARWQPLAEGGHAEAQYQLGKLYLHNGFAEASRLQGFFWLNRAAAQQHPGAVASQKTLDSVMSQEERLAARLLVQEAVRDEGAQQ
ncbi:MAG: hypothetical protein O2967_00550 [Proteobacteria bacterium]|nr:hypothetical protein [Pseudomonadota bacterium]